MSEVGVICNQVAPKSVTPVGCFEFLGSLAMALHHAHEAGTLQCWEPMLRSMVCTVYVSRSELDDCKHEFVQGQHLATVAQTMTLTTLGYARKLNEVVVILHGKAGKTSGQALKDHVADMEWNDPTTGLNSVRVMNCLKLVYTQLVEQRQVYAALMMVQCIHGRDCFNKWLWKLNAFATCGLPSDDLAAVIRGCHVLLKRGDVVCSSKFTVGNLAGRPDRGDLGVILCFHLRCVVVKWFGVHYRVAPEVKTKFLDPITFDKSLPSERELANASDCVLCPELGFMQHMKAAVDKVAVDFFQSIHMGEHDDALKVCHKAQQDWKSVNVTFSAWLDAAEEFVNAKLEFSNAQKEVSQAQEIQ